MTTIILTHWSRFSRLADYYGTDMAKRVEDALNSLPRREAYRWLFANFEGNPNTNVAEEDWPAGWECPAFGIYYNTLDKRFYAYI